MNHLIKVEAQIDARIPEQIEAFSNFMHAIGANAFNGGEAGIDYPIATETEKPKATRNRSKKSETAIVPERDTFDAEAAKMEVVQAEEVKAEPDTIQEEDDLMGDDKPAEVVVTIEQIRSKVSEKQSEHKEKIRAKLQEFEAANVTALPKDKYSAFYSFLGTL